MDVFLYYIMGVYKWKEMGICYLLEGIEVLEEEVVVFVNKILEISSYK